MTIYYLNLSDNLINICKINRLLFCQCQTIFGVPRLKIKKTQSKKYFTTNGMREKESGQAAKAVGVICCNKDQMFTKVNTTKYSDLQNNTYIFTYIIVTRLKNTTLS